MSVHLLQTVDAFCDVCQRGFGQEDNEPATSSGNHWTSSARTARREMKRYGWKRRKLNGRLVDICPQCESKAS